MDKFFEFLGETVTKDYIPEEIKEIPQLPGEFRQWAEEELGEQVIAGREGFKRGVKKGEKTEQEEKDLKYGESFNPTGWSADANVMKVGEKKVPHVSVKAKAKLPTSKGESPPKLPTESPKDKYAGWIEVDGTKTYVEKADEKAKFNSIAQVRKAQYDFASKQMDTQLEIQRMKKEEAMEEKSMKMQQRLVDFQLDPSQENLMAMKMEDEFGVEKGQIMQAMERMKEMQMEKQQADVMSGKIAFEQDKARTGKLDAAALDAASFGLDVKKQAHKEEMDKIEEAGRELRSRREDQQKKDKSNVDQKKSNRDYINTVAMDLDAQKPIPIEIRDLDGRLTDIKSMTADAALNYPNEGIQLQGMKAKVKRSNTFARRAGGKFYNFRGDPEWTRVQKGRKESYAVSFDRAIQNIADKSDPRAVVAAYFMIAETAMDGGDKMGNYPELVSAILMKEVNDRRSLTPAKTGWIEELFDNAAEEWGK